MSKYKIADLVFEINHSTSYSERYCKDYLYYGEESPACKIEVSKDDIDSERKICEGLFETIASDGYFEIMAIYRKICSYVLNNATGMFIHSSALAVDGKAYLFTAPSGTGKSTHARMWREYFGDKVIMVNDDKPLIREIDGKFYVFGTPWNGKHRLGTNVKYEIKALCKLKRGEENIIKKIEKSQMLMALLRQTIRPETEEEADKYFEILSKLVKSVGTYELECTISKESAKIAYETMSEGE